MQNDAPAAAPAGSPPGSALDDLLAGEALQSGVERAAEWLRTTLLSIDVAAQIVVLLFAVLPAALFGPHLKTLINRTLVARAPQGALKRAAGAFAIVATPVALLFILQAEVVALRALERPSRIVEGAVSLLTAWIVIRLVTLVIRSRFWSQLAFYVAWPIAALDAFGVLGRVVRELDALALPIGVNADKTPITFSALDVLRTVLVFAALFSLANLAARLVKSRIERIDDLTISAKALLARIIDVLTPVVALVIALQVVGFPFATLAIFGGAVGIGLGLGLQRTVANLFAGFTLIADKSIKPGDVIEIGETFGWVTGMNGRYVTVRTREGTEHLVPNERFIQDGVVNWSHSDRLVRLHVGFAIAYGTRDLRSVQALAERTAAAVERVVPAPPPVCNLVELADSGVKFDLRFWIEDPANGLGNVRSAVLLAVWDALHDNSIEIPYPQLDIRVKEVPAAPATL